MKKQKPYKVILPLLIHIKVIITLNIFLVQIFFRRAFAFVFWGVFFGFFFVGHVSDVLKLDVYQRAQVPEKTIYFSYVHTVPGIYTICLKYENTVYKANKNQGIPLIYQNLSKASSKLMQKFTLCKIRLSNILNFLFMNEKFE